MQGWSSRCRPRSSTRSASSGRATTTSPSRLMASYTVNDEAVARCRELIAAKQYVLDSDWGDVQPDAEAQNAYLERHSWAGLRRLAPRPHRGRERRDQGPPRVRLRRLPPGAPHRAHRLRLPRLRVAAQGRRAGRPRPAAGARPGRRHRLSRRFGAPHGRGPTALTRGPSRRRSEAVDRGHAPSAAPTARRSPLRGTASPSTVSGRLDADHRRPRAVSSQARRPRRLLVARGHRPHRRPGSGRPVGRPSTCDRSRPIGCRKPASSTAS